MFGELVNEFLDALTLARWQFGLTTLYHFLFVPLTIGLSFLVAILQTAWVRTGKVKYLRLTKLYGKVFLINFAMGVVTGIVQEFQFGMVDWESRTVAVVGRSTPEATTPAGKLLAKRQAVADAQRNLLYLLYELRYGLPERLSSIKVEGQVVMGHIDRQGEEDHRYVVEVSLPLHRLLEECVIWKAQVQ